MYDNRIRRQYGMYEDGTRAPRSDFVHNRMDDRDRISRALAASNHSREDLAGALGVSVPSVGRLLRLERRLVSGERDAAFRFLSIDDAGGLRRLPIIGEIGAGDWRAAIEHPIGHEWSSKGGPASFVLLIAGDSMDRVAPSGSRIVVDPDDRHLVGSCYYAVLNGEDEATFKQFRTDPARLEPLSTSARHRPIIIGSDDFKVIGRVVQAITDFG